MSVYSLASLAIAVPSSFVTSTIREPIGLDASKPVGSRIVEVTKLDGTAIAKDAKEYTLTTLDFVVYGGDGYVNVFTPAKAKVQGALLDVFVDALKADMAAGTVTQVPVVDGRIKKVG